MKRQAKRGNRFYAVVSGLRENNAWVVKSKISVYIVKKIVALKGTIRKCFNIVVVHF
jgi:hypothetical protein